MFKFSSILIFLFFSVFESSDQTLVELDENNWDKLLKDEWMVQFYAPWCPACKSLQPIWSEFAAWSKDLSVNMASVDITAHPGLSGRFMITALPSIFHVKDGVFRQYRGSRDLDSLISYVEEHKWSQTEPVSQWRAPNSPQMALVSHFFRLSVMLRSVHQHLTENIGMPVWMSYVVFAASTILVGSLLGLAIVFCFERLSGGTKTRLSLAPMASTNPAAAGGDGDLKRQQASSGEMTTDADSKSDQGSDVEKSQSEDESGSEHSPAEDGNGSGAEGDNAAEASSGSGSGGEQQQLSPRSAGLRKRRTRKAD